MDLSKVEGALNWPPPSSVKELRGFLGLSEYYRRFIRQYGVISKPLTTLLKKEVPWNWSDSKQGAFDKLKQAVTQNPILTLPNFKKEFCVEIDACGQGVRVALQQQGRPITFFSKGLGIKDQTLSFYDKEMLVVLLAVKKWHIYLVGGHFFIKIDHQSLRFLSDR